MRLELRAELLAIIRFKVDLDLPILGAGASPRMLLIFIALAIGFRGKTARCTGSG
jgi:hypothetical protein